MRTRTTMRWGAAVGALTVAAVSGVVWAPGADAAASTVTRTCRATVGGEKVKLRATLHLRDQSDNDVTAVDLRATDRDETGRFHNGDVDLRRIVLRVKDESGTVVARARVPNSPFAVDLGSAGNEVGKIHTEARFRTSDHVGVVECNFTFSESSSNS